MNCMKNLYVSCDLDVGGVALKRVRRLPCVPALKKKRYKAMQIAPAMGVSARSMSDSISKDSGPSGRARERQLD